MSMGYERPSISTTGASLKWLENRLSIDSGGGDNYRQILSFLKKSGKIAEKKVDVEASLMGLIDNNCRIVLKHAILSGLRQQDTVGHKFDAGVGGGFIVKTNLVPDQMTVFSQFLFNPDSYRCGGYPAGLGAADDT
jgi:hypothetical protein